MIIRNVQDEIPLERLQVVKMKYAMEILKSEVIKMILLFCFYSLLHMSFLFLFCLVLLLPVRTFSGGLHMKSSLNCFLFSFSFFLLSILVLPRISTPIGVDYLILASSLIIICICSPVATSRKPIVTREKYIRCKSIAIGTSMLASVLLLLLNDHQVYQQCGIWVLFLQALQLAIAFVFKRKEGFRYEKI
ncbi:accessory gene regulator B family protein [Clostridium aminobutyricum]|uniref:Accessory gene regulator B family protein n=1 Tax=Clostridium aminobutyricum TaxID=33953 RepID=A0A939IK95_CLOAM|nr:accessory gene regulator B family protein [Clostridium aminobutyricum]MBN7774374.1 accessory gene regulator B family protein [Clostridium aminobutyricum]